ncbi:MAG: hypothetical protein ACOCQP_00135 [Lentisphaeria bacterium]
MEQSAGNSSRILVSTEHRHKKPPHRRKKKKRKHYGAVFRKGESHLLENYKKSS